MTPAFTVRVHTPGGDAARVDDRAWDGRSVLAVGIPAVSSVS